MAGRPDVSVSPVALFELQRAIGKQARHERESMLFRPASALQL
jgi:hypothetical protein